MTRATYSQVRTVWQAIADDLNSGTITDSLARSLHSVLEDIADYHSGVTFSPDVASWYKMHKHDVRFYGEAGNCYIIRLCEVIPNDEH